MSIKSLIFRHDQQKWKERKKKCKPMIKQHLVLQYLVLLDGLLAFVSLDLLFIETCVDLQVLDVTQEHMYNNP